MTLSAAAATSNTLIVKENTINHLTRKAPITTLLHEDCLFSPSRERISRCRNTPHPIINDHFSRETALNSCQIATANLHWFGASCDKICYTIDFNNRNLPHFWDLAAISVSVYINLITRLKWKQQFTTHFIPLLLQHVWWRNSLDALIKYRVSL